MTLRNFLITIKYAGVQISFLSYALLKYIVGPKDFYNWSQTFGRRYIYDQATYTGQWELVELIVRKILWIQLKYLARYMKITCPRWGFTRKIYYRMPHVLWGWNRTTYILHARVSVSVYKDSLALVGFLTKSFSLKTTFTAQ